jgi:type IV pilus assembly protein PilB
MFEYRTKKQKEFNSMSVNSDVGDITEYTTALFNLAIELNASDIHIEPTRDYVLVRLRESGDFIYVDKIAIDEYAKLLSRLKILSNLRIDEKQKPQD